ncbi:MAG: DNA repair protein RadA, partial [Rhodoferax sp.]
MKQRSSFVCQQCSAEFPQWYGKCPNCDSWNSLVETVKESESTSSGAVHKKVINATAPQKLSAVKHIEKNRLKSGIPEFDRVMGGGIVPGSVTL